VRIPGRDRRLGTRDDILIGLRSAVYDAATRTVTLTTVGRIRPNTNILVTINAATDDPSVPVGVANLQGTLLDGNNDGRPGGVFRQVINSGSLPHVFGANEGGLSRFPGRRGGLRRLAARR
jgi:hypothetical protein